MKSLNTNKRKHRSPDCTQDNKRKDDISLTKSKDEIHWNVCSQSLVHKWLLMMTTLVFSRFMQHTF